MNSGLVYVSDSEPGISRRRRGRGFSYVGPDGTTIARGAERKRIEALAVPPAYKNVWICARANGHLQATGRDVRKRKQYRYHADWSAARAETKFDQLVDFGESLPRIRARVARDLKAAPGDMEFALASAVLLIDQSALRVGNEDYTQQNGSYGALTLRSRHLDVSGGEMALSFTAKGGKKVKKPVGSRALQRALDKVSDLPGATLLTWLDDAEQAHSLTSQQLNAYISDAAGDGAPTAKTFRTWAGTLAAYLCAERGGASIKQMAEAASERLHNTPTVARNSYIHPAVIDLAESDPLSIEPFAKSGLRVGEQRLMTFLSDQ